MIDHDRIHQYLLGEMNAEDRASFEAEVQSNPDLSQAIVLERKIVALLRYDAREAMKARLQKQHRQGRRRTLRLWTTIPIAAAAVIALLVYFTFVHGHDPYMEPPRGLFTEDILGADSDRDSLMNIALGYYDRHAFDSANATLIQYPDSGRLRLQAHFLRGHCLYKLDSAGVAAEQFRLTHLSSIDDSRLNRYSWWYLAVALAKSGDMDAAQAELQALRDKHLDKMDAELRAKVVAGF